MRLCEFAANSSECKLVTNSHESLLVNAETTQVFISKRGQEKFSELPHLRKLKNKIAFNSLCFNGKHPQSTFISTY